MKKLLFVFIGLSFCSPNIFAQDKWDQGKAEIVYVATFLMKTLEQPRNETTLRNFIAPSYFKNEKINKFKFLINAYTPVDFSVKTYNPETKIVDAKIWGENKKWIHLLHFKVVTESGKMYLYPGHRTDKHIDPWFTKEPFIIE